MSDADHALGQDSEATGVVGRDQELAIIQRLLSGEGAPCLVLVGDPGIGKTTLWESAIANTSGCAVLSSRCSQSEANLSFASLSDLVDGLDLSAGGTLPGPQLNALEVALGRRASTISAGEPLNIAAGFSSLIRHLASTGPLLIAVDDVQWLDAASADCLTFAARRLHGLPVRFLLTRQPDATTSVERELRLVGVRTLELGGLTFGAIRSIIARRISAALPRRAVRQISDTSHGNPLVAIELGRTLATSGIPSTGLALSVPELADDLFGSRARQLPAQTRRALLTVSLSGGLTPDELADVVGPLAVEDAVMAGHLTVERTRLRPTHPMLSAVIRKNSTAAERQALHLDLAAVVADPTLRTRHLALATPRPDAALAARVASASRLAVEHGDVAVGQELAAHAVRLTPAGDAARPGRLIALARSYANEGHADGVNSVLAARLEQIPPGRDRATAHMILGEVADLTEEEHHLHLAFAEAADDPSLQALVMARQAVLLLLNRVERVEEADRLAQRAVEVDMAGRGPGPYCVDPRMATALAWAGALAGRSDRKLPYPIDDSPSGTTLYDAAIERPAGVGLAFRGEVTAARSVFEELRRRAEERGEVRFSLVASIQTCELLLRSGHVKETGPYLEEISAWYPPHPPSPLEVRLRAMQAAVEGHPAEVRAKLFGPLLTFDPELFPTWDWLEAKRALGLADLLDERPGDAAVHLRDVWNHTVREGIDDPGAFPVAPDLVLALIQTGDLGAAEAVHARLERLSHDQQHPWGMATTQRSAAMLTLASAYDHSACAAMLAAAERYAELGLEFDQGRTLLCLGGYQRRHSKRADARRTLDRAELVFGALGAGGWRDAAKAELGRVSGRRPTSDALTVSERQVADLAASGMSNKEIATTLFVSVYTVEAHLSHAYAKLGVRSRSQLAGRLAPG